MPAVGRAGEDEAAVAERARGERTEEIREAGRGAAGDAPAVVEDQRLAAPARVPVLFGVEVEDVRAELLGAVAVRRDRAAARRVVPVEAQRAGRRVVEAAEELAVARREALVDQRDPRRRQLGLALGRPVERIAVVALLAVLALIAEILLEELEGRGRREELAVARLGERPLDADPREGARGAIARRID